LRGDRQRRSARHEEHERAGTARLRLATADSLRDDRHRAVRVGKDGVRDRPRHRD